MFSFSNQTNKQKDPTEVEYTIIILTSAEKTYLIAVISKEKKLLLILWVIYKQSSFYFNCRVVKQGISN